MGLDVWFREDVARILAAVAIARDGLTTDERTILAAICAGFGISLAEVLPAERQAVTAERGKAVHSDSLPSGKPPSVMQLPAMATAGWLAEQPATEEGSNARRFTHHP